MTKQGKLTKNELSLFALTWPIFVEVLLHMLMGNADTLMLSQYSDAAVAAVGVANQVLVVIIVMFGFVATGTGIIVAQYLGANSSKSASEVVVTALSVNFLFGLALSLVLFLFGKPILLVMNLPEELIEQALNYLKIVGGFSFVQALIMTVAASLRSYSFTKDAMYVTMGMNALNVIGNYLFIFGPFGFPVLGVTGVAIATSVSRSIGLVVLLVLIVRRIDEKLPLSMLFTFPRHHIRSLLKIGIPSAGEHLAYNMSQMMIMYFIAMMGTEAITTKVYTQNLMIFIFLFSIASGQGTQILIGRYIGAKRVDDAYTRCLTSLKMAMVISVSAAIAFSILSDRLFSIFTTDPDIITLGGTLLAMTIILEPGRAFNLVVINSLRATGDVKFPVYMGIISMWGISVPLAYVAGIVFDWGLVGVWLAFIVDEWLRSVIMLIRWRSRVWERMAFVHDEKELAEVR
ncbi:MATE family efflux transporter [Halobacillus amylolyticus]|uniref:MATE family efflux transporter n=1 Tax=Halobacillus amylolyticus TaxID=2932259 RepID=A0ABY4H988_9BACI|nr:MATE family efflux transporter [Halobacillus amylolyticus]UOR11008.1 MATE family efflux transporter [Halobacillus amylolyticus]